MSGEAGGLILIPLALAAMPLVLGGLAVAGVATAAVKAGSAAARYEQEQRQRREEIRRSGVANSIGDFRRTMQNNMAEQTRLNIKASEQMMSELQNQRLSLQRIAEQHDTQAYREYVATLKNAHTQTMQGIVRAQNDFNTSYREKIAESMSVVSSRINEQYSTYIDELQQLQADMAAKNKKAEEIADTYVKEAQTLLPIIDYYRPRPKSEARYQPGNRVTHVYSKSSTMVVEYNCVDDGGLVNDDAPIGKTFTLVNDIGLRAAVKIVEKREPPFNLFECDKDNYAPLGRYLAKGFIEGYTVFGEEVPDDKIPGIVIRMDENGEIVKLGIFPYTEADSLRFTVSHYGRNILSKTINTKIGSRIMMQ